MKAFAKTLADLHHVANDASIQEFPAEALSLLHQWIEFDGAVLGMGRADTDDAAALEIADAYVHGRDPVILDDYAPVSATDPVTRAFLDGLAAPLRSESDILYVQRKLDDLRTFSDRHDLRKLMLFGNAPSAQAPAHWVVLYRGTATPFSKEDAEYLEALWLHLSIAIDANRSRALEHVTPADAHRALALVNPKGIILAADPMFSALLKQEWPDYQDISLPPPALDCLRHHCRYRGKYVDIMFAERGGHNVCSARPASAYASLSPAENRVAMLFSVGLSQKEVARSLGVSEHTVRAQLKSSYSKLGVHDKAALARYVVSHS